MIDLEVPRTNRNAETGRRQSLQLVFAASRMVGRITIPEAARVLGICETRARAKLDFLVRKEVARAYVERLPGLRGRSVYRLTERGRDLALRVEPTPRTEACILFFEARA